MCVDAPVVGTLLLFIFTRLVIGNLVPAFGPDFLPVAQPPAANQ